MDAIDLDISRKRGCDNLATKRTSKTASTSSISKHQRATRFIVWYSILIIISGLIGEINANPTQRHSARHSATRNSDTHLDVMSLPRQKTKRSHGSTSGPDDWNNACGGTYDGTQPNTKIDKKVALRFLRKGIREACNRVKSSATKHINIDDIATWDKHKNNYKFIPKLGTNSSIALRRWYKNGQTFVAGFLYLYNVQHADDEKRQNGFGVSNELNLLMRQARNVLCEIESTINRTSASQNYKFRPVSQQEMDKRLKFTTSIYKEPKVFDVDLKYMKHYFFKYLSSMSRSIKLHVTKMDKSANSSSNSLSSESDTDDLDDCSESNEVNTSRSRSIRKKHRLGKNKKRQNKEPKRGRTPKNNNSLPTA